jgi:hypothetical protein
LLFAGTEAGLYISFDDGASWESFMGNLPIVPITDLTIKNKDLIVATQGRSFWILDDLSVIQQWKPEVVKRPIHLFASRPTYRMRGGGSSRPGATRGQNIRAGVPFWINVKEPLDEASTTRLEVRDSNEQIVTVFSTKPDRDAGEKSLSLNPGLNRIDWDMRYPGAKSFEGMVLWGGGCRGRWRCRVNIRLALCINWKRLRTSTVGN